MAFKIIRNDITKVKADVIVNTANPEAVIGSGVDFAIYKAAGAKELLAERKKIGYLNIGEVAITRAYNLDAQYIIHSSGPHWIDGKHNEEKLLRQSYDKALELAYENSCASIAFPLMSTGAYGFSKELGLKIALEAFNAFLLQHEMEIILVVFGENAFKLSGQIFDDVKEYVDNSYVNEQLIKEYRHFSNSRAMPPIMSVEATYSLDDYMKKDSPGTFGDYLQQLINKKGMKNSEVYTAANMTKQYFSKLVNGKVTPSKQKLLSLAIALRLNMDETVDFLRMSGYAFSPFSEVDKIFEYFIRNKIYDIYRIDIVLFDYGLPTLTSE